MTKQLQGKGAVITGGGAGIGRETALVFARYGASVCVVDRDGVRAEETKRQIEREGGTALAATADVADPGAVERAIAQAADRFGRLDIVFANAGVNGVVTPIEQMTPEEWGETIAINLNGTFFAVKYAIPFLKRSGGGSMIVTSSINGNRVYSNFGFSAYSTSKAGQAAFMKMAALELAQYGIRVNAICPGAVTTRIGENTLVTPEVENVRIPVEFPQGDHPLGQRPGTPAQVASLVLFLASDESSHITGTEIYIDGAESLLRG